MTITETNEDLKVSNDGDHDRFQHYFSKKDLSMNIMFGHPMTALCGKVVVRQVDPKGRTVCQTCQEIWEGLGD